MSGRVTFSRGSPSPRFFLSSLSGIVVCPWSPPPQHSGCVQPSAAARAQLMGKFSPLAQRVNGNGERERVKGPPLAQQVAPGQALHEVGLSLVLFGLGGLPGAALAREGHVPALVLGVLESRVVVLQDNLGENAVFASSFPLGGGGKRDTEIYGSNYLEMRRSHHRNIFSFSIPFLVFCIFFPSSFIGISTFFALILHNI